MTLYLNAHNYVKYKFNRNKNEESELVGNHFFKKDLRELLNSVKANSVNE